MENFYIVVIALLMLSLKINYAELSYSATVMHHLYVEQYKAKCIVGSLIEEAIIHCLYADHKIFLNRTRRCTYIQGVFFFVLSISNTD